MTDGATDPDDALACFALAEHHESEGYPDLAADARHAACRYDTTFCHGLLTGDHTPHADFACRRLAASCDRGVDSDCSLHDELCTNCPGPNAAERQASKQQRRSSGAAEPRSEKHQNGKKRRGERQRGDRRHRRQCRCTPTVLHRR